MLRALVSVAGLTAAFVGILYLAYSGDTEPETSSSSTPSSPDVSFTASPAPAATPVPTDIPDILRDLKIIPIEIGPPIDLPSDIALILETGCWGCEGGPSGLTRVYTRPDGSIVHEPLINREELGIPPQLNTSPEGKVYEFRTPLTGYAISLDGSTIVASLCARGRCGFGGGHYDWTADSQTAIFSSSDGGITWIEIGRIDVGAEVKAMFPDGRVLLATFPDELTIQHRDFPGLSLIEPPGPGYWSADALPNGALVWLTGGGPPVRSDGVPILPAPPGVETPSLLQVLFEPSHLDSLAQVSTWSPGGPTRFYLVPIDNTGVIGRGTFARGGESVVWSGGPETLSLDLPDKGWVFANATVPTSRIAPGGYPVVSEYVPVILDLQQAVMRPLRPFTDLLVPQSRNHVVAVQRGPFARVVNTDNTCLNIRAEPAAGAVLNCAAEGVLLTVLEGTAAPGDTWLHVRTPYGIEGWASAQYLER